MSFYMILNSNANNHYFPENKPYQFKSKMRQTLYLNGKWKVALSEIAVNINNKFQSVTFLDIYSDICGETIINGVYESLLRRIYNDQGNHYIFTSPYYIPVIKSEIDELEILIKTKGFDEELLIEPAEVVLHFKPCLK